MRIDMTNYKNQKNMSIEEMAKFNVKRIYRHGAMYFFTSSGHEYYADKYKDAIKNELEWLNKEFKLPKVGEGLIGQQIKFRQKFKVISVDSHKEAMNQYVCANQYVCLDEYVGKIGRFNEGFTFTKTGFCCTATFEKEYINAIDEENGQLCWKWNEVELLDD